MGEARSAAESYVAGVNAGDLEATLELFADHAVVVWHSEELVGSAAIRAFYRDTILPSGVQLQTRKVVAAGADCALEALATLSSGRQEEVVDLFSVDESGLVVRLAIYFRERR